VYWLISSLLRNWRKWYRGAGRAQNRITVDHLLYPIIIRRSWVRKEMRRRWEGCHWDYPLLQGIIADLSNHRPGWMRKRFFLARYPHHLGLGILFPLDDLQTRLQLVTDTTTFTLHLMLHLSTPRHHLINHSFATTWVHHHHSRNHPIVISSNSLLRPS
jgi:hypothetical protein